MAATNDYVGLPNDWLGLLVPATRAAAVTPSDSVELTKFARALIVGTAGDLKVVTVGGDTVVITGCPAGVIPIQVKQVIATGTTAVGITAIW